MWSGMKQRLGLKRMGCCSATWSPDASPMAPRESTAEDEPQPEGRDRATVTIGQVLECGFGARQTQGMNLAAALEAERNLRGGGPPGGMTTLMRLIEETDGVDLSARRRGERRKAGAAAADGGGGGGGEWLCCVCMEREKGAAFIPCGHAYCRECSRELCLGRGRCPVCNRSIVDILHLF